MSNEFTLVAEKRTDIGKGASRRLRREAGKAPAVIYGAEKAPESITILQKDILKALENEAFYSHILTLDVAGEKHEVILKDLQRHPAKDIILHADFLRVTADHKLTTHVPLHFINEDKCAGVKKGGAITHNAIEVEVRCLPADLPEFIEVDMSDVDLGQILHLSDIKLPKGVELVELAHGENHDLAIANIQTPRGGADEEAEEGESEA
ncbi:50S ribosomal protein L25/general stress protein Ctc [Endozoicomonas sp. SM1973]|uniref:Large ribosomal subunit protein bL25 n=1 Tax=Spartinivicinus marinus TaxID=2994442 RepID=A0A853IFE8_9GAMM|nr:50S ribosomal protein L25/general stress protein Ctc [Spartinivicinus marinus]MCX4028098.1 50S ribosomal protein L25/general stress protein Ctc [Spartinivicinus marinus]NYZ66226.1 50S ribosomal protein L25/general stress protein Ctc [Spartinivicinus marinus]